MLVLQAGKPDPVFPSRWAEHGAVGWAELLVVLLRLAEPPGLRRGIFDARAGRRSPNPTELGRGWWPGLGLYSRMRVNSAIPRGIAVLGA